jgi:hypothetical protein
MLARGKMWVRVQATGQRRGPSVKKEAVGKVWASAARWASAEMWGLLELRSRQPSMRRRQV